MSFTNYFENTLLNFIFSAYSFVTPDLYIGLARDTIDTSTGAYCGEVDIGASPEYGRLALSTSYWTTSTIGKVSNQYIIEWPETLTAWGLITHFVLFDAEPVSYGNLIAYGLLSTPWNIEIGSEPRFDVGDIEITLD